MRHLRTLTAISALSLALAAAPAALAKTSHVGDAGGSPTANICFASMDCTYVNYRNGKPTDVVAHAGTNFNTPLSNGSTGVPKQIAPMLHLLLSADVKS